MAYTSFKDLTFSKKLEHIWFYYKWYILVAIFFGFAAFICIKQFVLTPNYDTTVLWARHGNVPTQVVEEMREELEKYCPDLNGDGEVHVDVRFIGLAKTMLTVPNDDETSSQYVNNEVELTYKMKLVAEMTGGGSYIFMFDDMVYQTLAELQGYRDLSEFGEKVEDGCRINIENTNLEAKEEFGEVYLFFCSENAQKSKNTKLYNKSFEAFKAIVG